MINNFKKIIKVSNKSIAFLFLTTGFKQLDMQLKATKQQKIQNSVNCK